MAVLTTEQRFELQRALEHALDTVRWSKAECNLAVQAIEDWFEANKATGSAAIDTATSPFIFTGAEKKALFAVWLLQKNKREA